MTIVSGQKILAAPCCGARYSAPQYRSMNFSAFEYWTDGWRQGALMPNDDGLRRCACGSYGLVTDLIEFGPVTTEVLPRMSHVPDEELPACIAATDRMDVEIAARLGYWRYLNHSYREQYRLHRTTEEAATKAAWEAANLDRRSWWGVLLRRLPPEYRRPPDSPVTCPTFEPTEQQFQNMQHLCQRLENHLPYYQLELAELYREQGLFDKASYKINGIEQQDQNVTSRLIERLIREKQSAPTRYRM